MTDLATLADAADALCNPIRVRERYELWENRNKKIRFHEHTLPSLLDQLRAAVVPGEAYVEDDGGKVFRTPRSIPPGRLEAINACMAIDAGAAGWVITAGLTIRDSTAGNIRALVGSPVDSDTSSSILADLRRWYGWAATLSGWERPPWRPDAPCPLCASRGSLRVHLSRQTATCVSCGESWTPTTVGLLGEHIASLATVPMRDVSKLRLEAVLQRRAEEQRRLSVQPRPDLPYIGA